jgi:hypothetical protein
MIPRKLHEIGTSCSIETSTCDRRELEQTLRVVPRNVGDSLNRASDQLAAVPIQVVSSSFQPIIAFNAFPFVNECVQELTKNQGKWLDAKLLADWTC